jgi:hypothetical protein
MKNYDYDNARDNREMVINNDNDIKRQVPGVVNESEKRQKQNQLRDQELFYRATNYIG